MIPFTTTDRSTWPELLTADQVADIYRRKVGGVRKACQLGLFVPVPFQKQPYLWRKVDVIRHLDPGVSIRRAS